MAWVAGVAGAVRVLRPAAGLVRVEAEDPVVLDRELHDRRRLLSSGLEPAPATDFTGGKSRTEQKVFKFLDV